MKVEFELFVPVLFHITFFFHFLHIESDRKFNIPQTLNVHAKAQKARFGNSSQF